VAACFGGAFAIKSEMAWLLQLYQEKLRREACLLLLRLWSGGTEVGVEGGRRLM
jgi:hypothetical protein